MGANAKSIAAKALLDAAVGTPVDVRAYYVAGNISISKIHEHKDAQYTSTKEKEVVVIHINEKLNQYISVFSFGSMVFFNIPEPDRAKHIKMVMNFCADPVSDPASYMQESYKLIVNDALEKASIINPGHLSIRSLDARHLTIVSIVLAQSVAMDYHSSVVDKMVAQFSTMNLAIQETGDVNSLKDRDLHKLVAKNNLTFTNLLSKVINSPF
jgi:uncharacterized Rmd1/YagE family protein